MKAEKKVYYVKFIYKKNNKKTYLLRKNKYEILEEETGPFSGLRIVCNEMKMNRTVERDINILQKRLKGYDLSEAVVMADDKMSETLGVSDIFFKAKKYEMMNNLKYIMEKLKGRARDDNSLVIALESSDWKEVELYKILTVVKNYYKRIDVVVSGGIYNLSRISETVYEEWGLILHTYTYNSFHDKECNMALLLLKNPDYSCNMWKRKLDYRVAYMVSEKEICDSKNIPKGTFSGLKYTSGDVVFNELGVNMAYQKPVLYEKFHVSVIDICEM